MVWTIAWTASVNGPVMALYVKSLGIGIMEWSLLAASAALGMFLLEWVWGALYDKIDRRLLMIISVLGMSILFPLYTIQRFIPYFLVFQFITGAIGVALGPTTRAYVSGASPRQSIGLFSSLWWTSFILGRTIGPLLGAFIAQVWSFQVDLLRVNSPFLCYSGAHHNDFPEGAGYSTDRFANDYE